jgi:hypothetical protein
MRRHAGRYLPPLPGNTDTVPDAVRADPLDGRHVSRPPIINGDLIGCLRVPVGLVLAAVSIEF